MTEEEDGSSFGAKLLLDKSISLELDLAPDDDFAEEEDFSSPAELLLKDTSPWMLEELIKSTELLLDLFSLELDLALDDDFAEEELWTTLEEDGSSSFGAALLLLSSSHAARNATIHNATKIFFIKFLRHNGLFYPAEI